MARIVCPQCRTASTVPDSYLGRKVRCKACNTPFAAADTQSVTAAVPPPLPASAAVTVVARRVGAGPGASGLWAIVAVLAFILPVAGAGVFVALHWGDQRGGGGGG